MMRTICMIVFFVVVVRQCEPIPSMEITKYSGIQETEIGNAVSVSTDDKPKRRRRKTNPGPTKQDEIRKKVSTLVLEMFEKSEETMVFGLGLCNEPHSQDGKNTYAENVMRKYKVPQEKTDFNSHCLGLLSMIHGLEDIRQEIEKITDDDERAAILVDMVEYIKTATGIQNGLSSSTLMNEPIKSMLESNLDKLNVNFWNQMKSLTESHCASLNDSDLELSAHVIRLIVVDTQHRMQQKIVQDKIRDFECAHQIDERETGLPMKLYDDNNRNYESLRQFLKPIQPLIRY